MTSPPLPVRIVPGTAADVGLVLESVEPDALDDHVMALAQRIALIPHDLLVHNKRIVNFGVELQGREAIVAYARTFKDARPDLKFQMNGQRADGDIVVSRAIAMARGFLVDITSTMRFERGRVVEEWATYDEMTNEAANLAV